MEHDPLPTIDLADLQEAVLAQLRLYRDGHPTVADQPGMKPRLVRKAREYGVTNQRIGDALGVTEGAIRAMLRRPILCHDDPLPPGEFCGECGANGRRVDI